jgi:hypothetical protein
MKKITILLFAFVFGVKGFSQSKATPIINLTSNMTAQFTLNSSTSKVTLVLTGPSDRWFALGLGVTSGFSMSDGDVLVYSTSLTDRNYVGFSAPATDASQDWTTLSNNVNIATGIRTLTLERALTNSDTNDFQLPYATTSSISVAWARSASATSSLSNHGSDNRGFATASFTTLEVEDFSLKASSIFPNPTSGEFSVKTKTNLSSINVYSQTGALVRTILVDATSENVEVKVGGLQAGVYFLELQNDSEKTWKKVIIN